MNEEKINYENYPYKEKPINPLIGKVVTSVHFDDDHLTFGIGDGKYVQYTVIGDCCSHSYFHDYIGAETIVGHVIISVTSTGAITADVEQPDDNYYDSDHIKQYGVRFSAAPYVDIVAGVPMERSRSMVVEFRNVSNGYYGGFLEWPEIVDAPKGKKIA